jgi:quinohemoprotein ethanol dehydrogenase
MPMIGPEPIEGQRGALEAWDPVNRKIAWRTPGGGGIGGGTVSTAGNLLFQVLSDGRLLAYTADKGEKLLELKTGRAGTGAPVTYEIDGKQYVAFMGGAGRPANVVGPNDAKIDNPPLLFVFELDGKAPMPAAPPAPVFGGAPRGPAPPTPPPATELHK